MQPVRSIRTTRSPRDGQAMAEFVVGLIGILAVFAVIIQIGLLAYRHTDSLAEARAEAGEYAIADTYLLELPGPAYIRDWDPGPDGKAYSRDDTPLGADPASVQDGITSRALPERLNTLLPDNPVTRVHNSLTPSFEFGLVHGDDTFETNVLQIIRSLVYDAETIEMESDVWMTWTRGIY